MNSLDESLPLDYPLVPRDDSVVDNYHGISVIDPYRWLEDPDAAEVQIFKNNQMRLTESYLKTCDTRDNIREKITKLYNYPRWTTPVKQGNKYFYSHNTGLQAQNVLYLQEGLEGNAVVLFDPNELTEDGTMSLHTYKVSEDGVYLAYELRSLGSDWTTIYVMNIDDRTIDPHSLSWVKCSEISWTHDCRGFFYSRFPAPKYGEFTNINLNEALYYHVLGTDQSEDILCWTDPNHPKNKYFAKVTEDGKYVLLDVHTSWEEPDEILYYNMSASPNGLEAYRGTGDLIPFTKLLDSIYEYEAIANDDTTFTFRTNKDAPRYKLVRVDLKEPRTWTDVIPESKDLLKFAVVVNTSQILVGYMRDASYVLQLTDLETGSLLHVLPIDMGTAYQVTARRKDSTFFFRFTNFLTPDIIYECDLENGVPDMKIFREFTVPGFDRAQFCVNQVFFSSKDGTKVPMFIVGRKNTILDGSHPCLLYGYGGFSHCLTPNFYISRIVLMRNLGFTICIANIRGGGEYGEDWATAGCLGKKQNCFDDFISAAEYLVTAGHTSGSKLCIEGDSNGGLLVGACINQRPDLFGCALANNGVMDMLRFHKFTLGHAFTMEYGCPDEEEDFRWLIKYSPLHNVRRPWEQPHKQHTQYPSTMLLTADHDDRVVPLHTYKLLATMQHVLCTSLVQSPQSNPIIGRIEFKAGHGGGKTTQQKIDEAADRYSFMAKSLGAPWID